MGIWTDRMRLAQMGWGSDMRVTGSGTSHETKLSIGLWAKTWRWHGRISEVTIHAHAIVDRDEGQLVRAFDRLAARVLEGCERAWRDFPDCVPCQMPDALPDGRIALVDSSWETKHWKEGKLRDFEPERLVVPAWESGVYAKTAAQLSLVEGTDYHDEINPYSRPSFAGDTRPQHWQYETYLRVFKRNDIRIKSTRQETRTEALDETVVATIADASCRAILQMFDDYAPGGARHGETDNGLPPGYEIWPRPEPTAELDSLEP